MAAQLPPASPNNAEKKRPLRCRWLWRLAVVALLPLACFLARNTLLRAAAGLLVDEDPVQATDFVLPLGDPATFAEAARLCSSMPASCVLLIPPRPDAAQALGVLPTDEQRMRRELARAQAADRTVTIVPCPTESDWRRARLLGTWLSERPDVRVTAVCGRLQSARWRRLLRAVLPADAISRVRLRAPAHADPDYDETNWWHCKEGQLDALNSSLGYTHVLLCGEDEEKPPWNPDQYENGLR
jgi:hypothetical protein